MTVPGYTMDVLYGGSSASRAQCATSKTKLTQLWTICLCLKLLKALPLTKSVQMQLSHWTHSERNLFHVSKQSDVIVTNRMYTLKIYILGCSDSEPRIQAGSVS